MKRIEFIPGIDSMRGNLTGSQELKYAKNNNPAFYAPDGKQFARNYGASYIGAKRSSDGLKFFLVKRRSATVINAETLKQMAVFGAAGATIGSMYSQKAGTPFIQANAVYLLAKQKDPTIGSFRQWLSFYVTEMYKSKSENLNVSETTPAGVAVNFQMDNIFFDGVHEQTTGAEISDAIMVKFWKQLATNALYYKVAGVTSPILSHTGETFNSLFESEYNVLKLVAGEAISGSIPVKVPYGTNTYFLTVKDGSGVVGHDHSAIADETVQLNPGDSYYLSPTFITGE